TAKRVARRDRVLESVSNPGAWGAAVRVLAARKTPGAAEALLAFIPGAHDDGAEDHIRLALAVLGIKDGKAAPALVTALGDKEPSRRRAAGYVVGQSTDAAERRGAAELLADADHRVRFFTAAG